MPDVTIYTTRVGDVAVDRPTHGVAEWDKEQVVLRKGEIVPEWVPAEIIAHLLASRLVIKHTIAVEETKK